jgi:hypothetical protein
MGWMHASDLGWGSRPKLHGMQGVRARIGLAAPGRPIGPWSRRTGAPKASATRRDRSPPVHGGYTRSRQVEESSGHERSRTVARSRRSSRQPSHDLVVLQEAGRSSSLPTQGCGGLAAFTNEAVGQGRVPSSLRGTVQSY